MNDFPLARYWGAVLMRSKLRRETTCADCREPIPKGAVAWRTLVEDIGTGLHRGLRWCERHFRGGDILQEPRL